ncbi:MASE1 domain-containing protein [Streptomyces cacaoi]|uniref:MASE1 domain-containing protein n=1 Tax=Streptomyces cacaoi TaxID=1898 RepID=UPI0036F90A55
MARTSPATGRAGPEGRSRRLAADCLRVVVIAVVYYAGGRLGLLREVTVEGAVVTPFWPPTGIAVSALLFFGYRAWPGIAIGATLVIWTMADGLDLSSIGFVAGNTLAPLLSYALLRRTGFRHQLDRLRDGAGLVFLGAFAGMLISATTGALMAVTGGDIDPPDFWPVWTAWWAGDVVGVLVVTPLLLAVPRLRRPRGWPAAAEAVVLMVATALLSVFATRSTVNLLFLVFPLLVWASLRFQLAGSAFCVAVVSVSATWAATERTGGFARHSLIEGMISLQALNGSAALTALLLAAVTAEKRNTLRRIEEACAELAEMVDRLAPGSRSTRL